jgi:hypothetical protein
VSSQISGDKDVINLSFADYAAQDYKGAKGADNTKNCNVNLKVRFPPGFTLTVATTDVRGFALLDQTCQATIGGRFWWSGQQKDVRVFPSPDPTSLTKAPQLMMSIGVHPVTNRGPLHRRVHQDRLRPNHRARLVELRR